MHEPRIFEIEQKKAMAPLIWLMVVFMFFSFTIWMSKSNIIFATLSVLIPLAIYFTMKSLRLGLFKKRYFLSIGDLGVEYRTSIFSRHIVIPWQAVQLIKSHMYEVNFKIKENNRIASFQTRYLNKDQRKEALDLIEQYWKNNQSE